MAALACLAGQATVAAAQTPHVHAPPGLVPQIPYPTAAVFAAVRDACADLSSAAAAEATAARQGWTQAPDAFATPIGPLVRMGYEAAAKAPGVSAAVKNRPAVFSRTVAGEALYLVVSAVEVERVSVTGCRVYDPGEKRGLDMGTMRRLIGRPPSRSAEQPVIRHYEWKPGLVAGQDSFAYFAIPDNSPLKPQMKFSGLAFKADQVGTVQR